MPEIRQLPDDVINQIAAGEVVERPASVLKELLENAVDSGTDRVEAEVSGTFPFTIRVSDHGIGMTAPEVEAAIRRHTTSKIASAQDLQRIATYGFRGEALPSIAAVSRLRILTRPASQRLGTELVAEGGAVRALEERGAPAGTTVEVGGLFGNVPARRKFLKTPRTELFRLWEVFHQVAIPNAGIFFRMTDGREEKVYEARETAVDRAFRHAGEDAAYLARIERFSPFYRLSGWVGLPQVSRAGGSGIHTFVNGRHFRDRTLIAALREAYRGILPADRQPVAYLFIGCDPAEVDVNVHPAKTEVRFRYARELFELVRHAAGEALGEIPPAEAPGPPAGAPGPPRKAAERPLLFPSGEAPPAGPASGGAPSVAPAASRADVPLPGGTFFALRPIGQLLGTYIVCEGAGEAVIIDQHAGHERIVFSRLKDAFLGEKAPVQHWLVPRVIAFRGTAGRERAAIEEFLARVGFVFEPFGEDALKVMGGPAILGTFDVSGWWKDMEEFLREQESLPKGIFDADRELWRMACHGAVRAGDTLTLDGMRRFLSDLDRAVAAHSCPHGRPVWVRISSAEMGRMFHRS